MARNRVIGRDNQLPWHMPADLKYFKHLTADHAVIMGRRTFESIQSKPLPGRTNVIVTRDRTAQFHGALVVHDLAQAITLAAEHDRAHHHKNEVFVLGGSEIFREALPLAHRMYLTLIDADVDGDTHFPDFDRSQWKLTRDEPHAADERNPYPYRFQMLEKLSPETDSA